MLFPASCIKVGAGALLASNGLPTGLGGTVVTLELGELESPKGFEGEGPIDETWGFMGIDVNRSRFTRLALVPRNWASTFGRGCGMEWGTGCKLTLIPQKLKHRTAPPRQLFCKKNELPQVGFQTGVFRV